MRRIIYFALMLAGLPLAGQTGDCSLRLKGRVIDRSTDAPLMYANIYIRETGGGAASDSAGYFILEDLCPGEYHLRFSHLGCETEEHFLQLVRDTVILVRLHHHDELLDELVVHGHLEDRTVRVSTTISHEEIAAEGNKNLSDILDEISGVTVLQSGSGISKPVIHGLYGNRISILNNGLVQSGQQWGNDHAPEIDPFVADHISVVKGASALAYGGNSLGSLVLIEPSHPPEDPHLHGEANYIFHTNGLGHTLNAKLEKNITWAAWKVLGTAKVFGDSRSPDYYLTNTGKREYNGAVQIHKHFSNAWELDGYYSIFHTQIGILRGSHIGNVTDLEEALERDEPFFTKDKFSYSIEAPYQKVNHHLVKLESTWSTDNIGLKLKYGAQLNERKEFDVRRSGRSDIPALSLKLQTHYMDGILNTQTERGHTLQGGLQYEYQYNKNNPETGILPLIPDYTQHGLGMFFLLRQQKSRWFYETGLRYDLTALEAITITTTLPREILRIDHLFHGISASGGARVHATEFFDLSLDAGFTQRAPAVNELYSYGLHQGVSGIEEGNDSLNTERSIKLLLSAELDVRQRMFLEVLAYYQHIGNFIYLEPQDELRLTIRGAFPVFVYKQTDARIAGMDVLLSIAPVESLKLIMKYALVRGWDREQDIALINMPSDNISAKLSYDIRDAGRLRNTNLSLEGEYVFRQSKVEDEHFDDAVVEAPDGYFLLGFSASTEIAFAKGRLGLHLDMENMLNTTYRDYLNRQRYFADDLGINVSVGLSYTF